jgi:transposase
MSGKRGKNDTADAAAICEAVTRPNMRFVLVKEERQQIILCQDKLSSRTLLARHLGGRLSAVKSYKNVSPKKAGSESRAYGALF